VDAEIYQAGDRSLAWCRHIYFLIPNTTTIKPIVSTASSHILTTGSQPTEQDQTDHPRSHCTAHDELP
jgi:hypothetical protein